MSSFKNRYPEFASIETQIRRAHAERQVAIATAVANGIVAGVRGIGRLFTPTPAARTAGGGVLVKATIQGHARV